MTIANRKRGISYPRPTAKGLANSPKAPDSAEWVSAESFISLRTSLGFSAGDFVLLNRSFQILMLKSI